MYFLSFSMFLTALRVIFCANAQELQYARDFLSSNKVDYTNEEYQKELDISLNECVAYLSKQLNDENILSKEADVIGAIEKFIKHEKVFLVCQYIATTKPISDKIIGEMPLQTHYLPFTDYIIEQNTELPVHLPNLSSTNMLERKKSVEYLSEEIVILFCPYFQYEFKKILGITKDEITKNTITNIHNNIGLLSDFFDNLSELQKQFSKAGGGNEFTDAVCNALLELCSSAESSLHPDPNPTQQCTEFLILIYETLSAVRRLVKYEQDQNKTDPSQQPGGPIV